MRVIHFSLFFGLEERHGGVRRSEQIRETLIALSLGKFEIETVCLNSKDVRVFGLFDFLKFFAFFIRRLPFLLLQGYSVFGIVWLLRYGAGIFGKINAHKAGHAFLEYSVGVPTFVALMLSDRNIPYSILPHNIEFMVPNQRDKFFRSFGAAVEREVSVYRHAVVAHCISRFDQSILDCFSIKTNVFPYFPVMRDVKEFHGIRRMRLQRKRGHVLILGTAYNPPTKQGMEVLLKAISDEPEWRVPVVVAGYGTEAFDGWASDKIKIMGCVSSQSLKELMVQAHYVIVAQPATTGFMTRLIECNLSGVPVFIAGSYAQAEGLESMGIFRFKDVRGLLAQNEIDMEGLVLFPEPSQEALLLGVQMS